MTPVLVTGASGYLGARVVALLRERGALAAATARRSDGCIPCDLTERRAVADLLAETAAPKVVHCAAAVPKSEAGYRDEEAAAASLSMVDNLIAAAPRQVVFPSSMCVYSSGSRMPVHEEDAGPPASGYAGAKRKAEIRLMEAAGVRCTVLRLPSLFGHRRAAGACSTMRQSRSRGGIRHRCPPIRPCGRPCTWTTRRNCACGRQ